MDTPKLTTCRTLVECEFRLHLSPGDRSPLAHISGAIEHDGDGWRLHGYVGRGDSPRQGFALPLAPDGEFAQLLAAVLA